MIDKNSSKSAAFRTAASIAFASLSFHEEAFLDCSYSCLPFPFLPEYFSMTERLFSLHILSLIPMIRFFSHFHTPQWYFFLSTKLVALKMIWLCICPLSTWVVITNSYFPPVTFFANSIPNSCAFWGDRSSSGAKDCIR